MLALGNPKKVADSPAKNIPRQTKKNKIEPVLTTQNVTTESDDVVFDDDSKPTDTQQ